MGFNNVNGSCANFSNYVSNCYCNKSLPNLDNLASPCITLQDAHLGQALPGGNLTQPLIQTLAKTDFGTLRPYTH